jgi:hypothetical protein
MRPIRLILSCCLLLAACHKHVPVAVVLPPPPSAPPPPNVSIPPPVVTPLPVPVPEPLVVPPLRDADRAFNAGNYDEAAHLYEDYLRANSTGILRDQALFNLATSLALRAPTATDWAKVTARLKELVDEYPESPLKPPAAMILSLRSEIDQLNADSKQQNQLIKQLKLDLDRLKKIDADRPKRR